MLRKTVCLLTLSLFLLLTFRESPAQSDDKKFEVGAQVSVLQIETRSVEPSPSFSVAKSQASDFGFGGRFGYNISSHFALEAEVNFFPQDRDVKGGRKIQGLFGVKAGKHFDKVGLFAKARPGFIRYEKGDYFFARGCIAVFPPPLGCFDPVARTSFAMDLGGVVELYPSSRTIIRFDAGDTIVRLPARLVAAPSSTFGPPGSLVAIPISQETKHQFQGSVGFGFRF